ncbi:MAG: hypothetical protein JSR58_02435 [Verrucomicrobia bacterium]|nr:hypothetical protein [Verrucomicrobiota bacterium]
MTINISNFCNFIYNNTPSGQMQAYEAYAESLEGFQTPPSEHLDIQKEDGDFKDVDKRHSSLPQGYKNAIQKARNVWYQTFCINVAKIMTVVVSAGLYLHLVQRIPEILIKEMVLYCPLALILVVAIAAIVAYKKSIPILENTYETEKLWAKSEIDLINKNENDPIKKQKNIVLQSYLESIIKGPSKSTSLSDGSFFSTETYSLFGKIKKEKIA